MRSDSTVPDKGETKAQKDWRLARSLGLDDAILYLVGQAVASAKLSMRSTGDRATLAAMRATALADSAASLALRKRHKLLRLTSGYRQEIHRARELAAEAFLLSQQCTVANAAFRCVRRTGHSGKCRMERHYA